MTGRHWICVANICAVVLAGCGGSNNTDTSGLGSAVDGGLDAGPKVVRTDASVSDAGTMTMEAPIIPLADNSAGKACMSDSSCGGGTCGASIMSTAGGALGSLLGATAITTPGGYCTGPCRTDTDCGAGGVCVGAGGGIAGLLGALTAGGTTATPPGECQAACVQDSDCRDGYSCGAFVVPTPDGGTSAAGGGIAGLLGGLGGNAVTTCQPLPPTDQLKDKVVGHACMADSDCAGGTCATSVTMGMTTSEYPDGYCSGNCLSDKNCGAGGVCMPPATGTGAGACYAACASDADCTRDGYRCRNLGNNVMACNPAAKPLPDNTVGKACSSDAVCGGNIASCASALPAAGAAANGGFFGGGGAATLDSAPGGYCSNSCTEDSDCGAGGVCVGASMNALTGNVLGACFKRCSTSDDCRVSDGYGCELRGGAAAGLFGGGGATAARSNVCVPLGGSDAGD